MPAFKKICDQALVGVGRQGTLVLVASLVVGIAVPQLAIHIRPIVPELIFCLLVLAILRVDPHEIREYIGAPFLIAAAVCWIMVILPVLFCSSYLLVGKFDSKSGLLLALVLQLATPPIMSSPAIAALLGLDAALALVVMFICSALVSLSAPLFVHVFAAHVLNISSFAIGAKLFFILGGAVLIAMVSRRVVGAATIKEFGPRIDGLSVLVMAVFIFALMGDVGQKLLLDWMLVIKMTSLAFVIAVLMFGLTALVFYKWDWARTLSLGLVASQRNMGLMLAAMGAALPDITWLYFAVAQIPIYTMPQLLKMAMRLLRRAS